MSDTCHLFLFSKINLTKSLLSSHGGDAISINNRRGKVPLTMKYSGSHHVPLSVKSPQRKNVLPVRKNLGRTISFSFWNMLESWDFIAGPWPSDRSKQLNPNDQSTPSTYLTLKVMAYLRTMLIFLLACIQNSVRSSMTASSFALLSSSLQGNSD